ncbi:MFS family permease [Afipia massiliensis]|uniref:MFS family permease n=1 Tax=Afipia massiliensis TaxID=211460 RepID=A0A840N4F4_9BRAD|nr:MFS transporter [Afipia massiliensis]MBB5054943.1 MFS family permease [Afipia massiliensis]
MTRDRIHFLFLNIGHYLDHLFTLIFATVAALALSREWGLSYGELLTYATPGFFAFGLFALPAGWLADKWSREGMIAVFFVGIGASSIATAFAQTPLQMGIGLFVVGVFAAIYHPVGLAIVTQRWKNTGMRLAVNGVWGNLGVASAALITGYFIDNGGWRMAFVVPGVFSIIIGVLYAAHQWSEVSTAHQKAPVPAAAAPAQSSDMKALILRISAIVFLTTAVSSLVFQSTTFALPKIFDERLQGIATEMTQWLSASGVTAAKGDIATMVGAFTFIVFAVASLAQLVVGSLLDKLGPRTVFLIVAAIQIVFFALMPGLRDAWALAAAFGFMLGAFGQIPINDFMIGKMASGEARARIYGVRYVVSFTVLALALPMISFVYGNYGFDTLFRLMASAAAVIFVAVACLPARLPTPATAPHAA